VLLELRRTRSGHDHADTGRDPRHDRIAGPRWKKHAFGDGSKTVLELLDETLAGD